MAAPWIKIEHTMPDKPEVDQLSNAIGIPHDEAVGKLLRFWIWADQQSVSGNAISVTKSFLDRLTNCPGFADGLLKVGWLTSRNGRFSVPNFDRHNGQTAKARALTTDRVKRSRNAASVTGALPEEEEDFNSSLDTNVPSSKEVKKKNYPEAFKAFWNAYPLKTGKEAALKAWVSAGKRIKEATGKSSQEAAAALLEAAKAFAASPKGQGEFCPHPATWLNQGRYDDDPAAWHVRANGRLPFDGEDPRGNAAAAAEYVRQKQTQRGAT